MLFSILIVSVIFIAIGFILTENNAKYLLSGYNTMSEEERKKVDIKAYISYFQKFHIFLGISFFVFTMVLDYSFGKTVSDLFIGLYPVVAYVYFAIISSNYSKAKISKWNKIGIITVSVVFLLVMIAILCAKFQK